jgi:hypothetical protein
MMVNVDEIEEKVETSGKIMMDDDEEEEIIEESGGVIPAGKYFHSQLQQFYCD